MNARSRRRRACQRPTLDYERFAWRAGCAAVAGVDEAGRGAWAGPLVAAATVLPQEPVLRAGLTRRLNREHLEIRDSKQLRHQERLRITEIARELGIPTAIAMVDVLELDRHGLGVANRLALHRAVSQLDPPPDHVLVDAFRLDDCAVTHEPIIGGDQACRSIAMASIVAKVYRDLIMINLDEEYPGFGFATHKGYGTRAHAAALDRFGVTPVHRRCFSPIARYLDGHDVQG